MLGVNLIKHDGRRQSRKELIADVIPLDGDLASPKENNQNNEK